MAMLLQPLQSSSLSELVTEWNAIKDIDNRRGTVIESLFSNLKKAEEEVSSLKNKLELNEIASHDLLETKKQLLSDKADLQRRLVASPFVLVLIDGDNTLFLDSFVSAGAEGGHSAAHKLQQAMEGILVGQLGLERSTKLIVRIYYNAKGLQGTYATAGIADESNFTRFIRSFNSQQRMTKYIDSGSDKEAADNEIIADMDLFWHNENCKHIILAGSADKGYVNPLRRYSSRPEDQARLTLVESIPFPREFKQLAAHFSTTSIADLFRSTKIDPEQSRGSLVAAHAVAPTWVKRVTDSSSSTQVLSHQAERSPEAERSRVPTGPSSVVVNRRLIRLNQHKQRIDEPLRSYHGWKVPDVHARRLCARHYLTHCLRGNNCEYSHEGNVDDEERRVLARIARNLACRQGLACMDPDCVSGHQCLHDAKCDYGDECKFSKDQHGVEKVVVQQFLEVVRAGDQRECDPGLRK